MTLHRDAGHDLLPCSRRNPHTPHDTADGHGNAGRCLGSAPEFPWEDVEIVADEPLIDLAKAKQIADGLQFACRDPERKPDFTACGGPAAEAYWEYFTPARVLALLGSGGAS